MSEWISINDRLPKEGEHVLGYIHCSKSYASVSLYVDNGNYFNPTETWWIVLDDIDQIEIDDVSHWMPLPTPPKEFIYDGGYYEWETKYSTDMVFKVAPFGTLFAVNGFVYRKRSRSTAAIVEHEDEDMHGKLPKDSPHYGYWRYFTPDEIIATLNTEKDHE